MITFLTGVPGSGKTYKAVYTIFHNFSDSPYAKKELKKDYKNCYTNINEFKFDLLKNVYPFDYDEFKPKIIELHNLYKSKASDDELIAKCKELQIYKTFFVIDECHNFFDTSDAVLIWWLSYHRHLFHDIILITQNLALIFSKYKSFSEYFYQAKPITLVLNRKYLVYDSFISSRLSKSSHSGRLKIKKDKNVFELYKSGDNVEAKNVVLKYLILAFIFLIVVLVGLFTFINLRSPSKPDQTSTPNKNIPASYVQSVTTSKNELNQIKTITKDQIFLALKCSSSFCNYENNYIPISFFSMFKDDYKIKFIDSKNIGDDLQIIYLLISSDFKNLFQGANNEDSDFSNLIPKPFS